MRYELVGGPLDGTLGDLPEGFAGNLHFPREIPVPDGHDPCMTRGEELRYRRTGESSGDRMIYLFDGPQHRQ